MRAWLALLAVSLFLTSCQESLSGNGIVQRDKRAVDVFDEIDISGQFNVYVRQGADPGLIIETDENFLPFIKSEVSGDRLKIWGEKHFTGYDKLDVYITTREIKEIDLSGAVVLTGSKTLRSKKLEVDASGAAEINMEVQCEKFYFDGSGACTITLTGICEEAHYDLSGAGEIEAFDLQTRSTSIDMSGAASANVYVTDKLNVHVSGAGEVNYKGKPKEIKQDISGAAEINQL
jgi:hypothetical protein